MRQRFVAFVLFVSSLTSTSAFADGGWGPDGPKCGTLFTQIAGYFQHVWNYLVQ